MNTILELLVAFPMIVNFIKTPQPPERLDRFLLSYPLVCYENDTKLDATNKKLEENHKNPIDVFGDLAVPKDDDKPEKKTIYNMSESELNALSLKKKAKLLHMNKKTFKTFVKLVNREAGPKMQDKILVAAVVWNRKYCKQYPNTVRKVMYQGGQFTVRGQKKTVIYGDANDKKAQLAILLAYRMVKTNQIPHNVMNFNSISYRQGSPSRFKRYKHYNNYFLKDTRCKCSWCKESS
jgi:hypothetical protein